MHRILNPTKVITTLALAICFGLLLVGCGSSTDNSNANTSNANTSNANTSTSGSNTNKAGNTSTTASTSGDKVGVPACDEYIEKYEACLKDKVPAAAQAQFRASLDTMRKSWREAAATPQGKAGLAQGCQAALNAAKQSMSSYGCNW